MGEEGREKGGKEEVMNYEGREVMDKGRTRVRER